MQYPISISVNIIYIHVHVLYIQDAHSSDREGGEDSQSVTDDVPAYGEDSPLGAGVLDNEEGDGDVEEMEDDEGEDELDLEYEFDDEDEDGADYELSLRKLCNEIYLFIIFLELEKTFSSLCLKYTCKYLYMFVFAIKLSYSFYKS